VLDHDHEAQAVDGAALLVLVLLRVLEACLLAFGGRGVDARQLLAVENLTAATARSWPPWRQATVIVSRITLLVVRKMSTSFWPSKASKAFTAFMASVPGRVQGDEEAGVDEDHS